MSTHPRSAGLELGQAASGASPACARLVHNRERLAFWLEQDRAAQAQPTLGGWALRAVLPLLDGMRQHPTAPLALGSLAQAWLRSPPADGRAWPVVSQALGAVRKGVKRHPKVSLAVAFLASAAWWWSRSRPRV